MKLQYKLETSKGEIYEGAIELTAAMFKPIYTESENLEMYCIYKILVPYFIEVLGLHYSDLDGYNSLDTNLVD